MNLKTTLFLALAGLVVAVTLLLVEQPWKSDTEKKEPEKVEKALFEKAPEGVDRVEVALKDGKRAFKRQGEDWLITAPIEGAATSYEVSQIVDAVTGLKYERVYKKGDKDRPSDAVSGLGKPTVVKLFKGDTQLAAVEVGGPLPTGTGNFVRQAGSEDILEAKADLSKTFDKRLDVYRDKRVVKFEPKDARKVTVEGTESYVLVKNGEDWVLESPMRARTDKSKVDALVRQVSSLSADEWQKETPTSYGIYQLEPPQLQVTVETSRPVPAKYQPGDKAATRPADTQPSTETVTYTVMIGGTTGASSTAYFARLGSKPWVFTLGESKVKPLIVPVADLTDKTLAKIDQAKVKKVDVQAGGESMALTKGADNKWTFADGTVADMAAVEDLVKAAAEMKATTFADRNSLVPQDWSKPRAKVAITVEGQIEPVTLLVGSKTPSGRMVYVKNAAEQPVAAVNEDLVEPLLQPPVAYRDRQVFAVARDRVSKLEIQRAGGPAVTLTKNNLKWSMVAPVAASADADAVRNLLSDLTMLQAKRVAGAGDKAPFGLDKPDVTLAVWVDPLTNLPNAKVVPGSQPALPTPPLGTQPVIKPIGPPGTQPAVTTQPALPVATQPATTQPAPPEVKRLLLARKDDKVYATIEGSPMVWEIDKRVYDDATAEMHDRQITRFDIANIVDVSFEQPPAALTFRKSGEDWRYEADPLLPVDKQKVTDALNGLREIKTHRYVDYAAADLGKYGLGDDAQRIVIGLGNGQKTEIRLSKTGPADDLDKSRYAVVAGTQKVFLLKEDQAKKFERKLADFEKSDKPGATPPPPGMGGMPGQPGGPGEEPDF